MILQKRNSMSWFVVLMLISVLGFVTFRYLRRNHAKFQSQPVVTGPQRPNFSGDPSKPAPPKVPRAPVEPGFAEPKELRVSDDAESKTGDFWLEQPLEISDAGAAAAASKEDLLDLYVAFDAKSSSGPKVRLKGGQVFLDIPKAAPAPAGDVPAIAKGDHVLGVLWRRGELSIWMDSARVLNFIPPAGSAAFSGPSAVQVYAGGIRLGARRALSLNNIRFDDNFMRETSNDAWRPLYGQWELTAMTFPERSANPFSLRAAFGSEKAAEDPLFKARMHDNDYGIGVMLSPYEGTLHIARITGGSPAARAGLAEDDIFLEIDGYALDQLNIWEAYKIAYQLLMRGYAGDAHIKILRPGEKQPRTFSIKREYYKWGTPVDGIPIEPVNPQQESGSDRVSMIVGGEPGWSDYAAEVAVKPLGAGGMGLAVAYLSPEDYVLFRWRGPADRTTVPARPEQKQAGTIYDKLQLVRVSGGKETILAERTAGYRPYEFYRMGVDWSGEKISCLLDGNEVLKADVPDIKRGQVALYALKGEPVFFDDVHISSDREVLNAAHSPERKLNSIFVFEDDMEIWANPALEWQRDIKTGWAVHQARFPGDQAVILNKPRFADLTLALFCSENPDENGGTLVVKGGQATISGKNWTNASANVGAGPFDRIAVRATKAGIEAEIGGTHLKADAKEQVAALGRNPLDRVAIRGLRNLGDPSAARVTSSNLLEYTFDTSPTDWKVECGRWGLLNKWICDPRWSWFGGRAKTLAALWNKYVFSGDLSVEAHVALMMQKEEPPYERPGDYNISICGDGVNLDSGYTLIFGGDNNSWTRLYRKGRMVAESWKEDHRLFSDRIRHPDKPELHQRWFHLKLEKIGNTLTFHRDNMLAFTFVDPDPLPDGRLAFWTLDNGFLLSRVRIAHGGIKPAPFEPRDSNLYEDARVINMFDGEVLTSVEPQALPEAIQSALAAPKNAFKPADAPPLPVLSLKGRDGGAPIVDPSVTKLNPGQPPPAWRVVNGTGGGAMALQWKSQYVDPENCVLRFAYRIEPGANVDLYLIDQTAREQGQGNFNPRQQGAYRWRLSGPKESDEFAPLAGEVPGVQADGQWHAVQFDLNPSWRAFWHSRGFNRPARRPFRLMLGNLDNHGYLLAGIGGNHAGAAYSVSDFSVLAPHDTDNQPPKVERVIWPYDAEGDGHTVTIVFEDAGGSGVQDDSIQLTLNGVSVARELQDFDFMTQRLHIDLIKLGFPAMTEGQQMKLSLLGFQDRARNPAEGYSASFTYTLEQARKAAKLVFAPRIDARVAGVEDPVASGPLTLAQVGPAGPGLVARLQESSDAPPWAPLGEKQSLQVVSGADGTSFGFQFNNIAYEMRHFPYIELDYKVPPEMPFNLHFNDRTGALNALVLTDIGDARDPNAQNIATHCGPPADFVADGMWHRSIVPLQRLFQGAFAPEAAQRPAGMRAWQLENLDPQPAVVAMGIYDNGWRGNRRGMQYWFHRVQPVPAGRTGDFVFNWHGDDVTGIADYASCIDDKPETDPAGKQELASGENLEAAIKRRGAALNDCFNFVHLRVKNSAGVWSEAVHRRFMLDNQPPKVIRTEPKDGASYAGQTLKIYLGEEHGVEMQSLQMTVNGAQVSSALPGVSYDPVENSITFDAAKSGLAWPDGKKIQVAIQMLRDSLGNGFATPFTFSFNSDRGSDREGPVVSHMRWVSPALEGRQHREMEMETSFVLDFEEHLGHVHATRDCLQEWIDNPAEACFGRRAVKFTALEDDADAQIMLHKNAWYLDRVPILQFDYKADPGFCVDLMIEVMGEWSTIKFTGTGMAPAGGKTIGAIADVVADGKWRHASVDLRALIDAARPDLNIRIASKFIFSAQGQPGCKRGSTLTIDNLDMSVAQGASGRFEFEATDPSGIAGYSFVMDKSPDTIPPSNVNQVFTQFGIGNQMGVIYAHVKACDQAGNWGPARTLRVDMGQ